MNGGSCPIAPILMLRSQEDLREDSREWSRTGATRRAPARDPRGHSRARLIPLDPVPNLISVSTLAWSSGNLLPL